MLFIRTRKACPGIMDAYAYNIVEPISQENISKLTIINKALKSSQIKRFRDFQRDRMEIRRPSQVFISTGNQIRFISNNSILEKISLVMC